MVSKKELAKKALEYIDKEDFKKVSDTQIRNFVEAAKNSDNLEELIIYLKYQGARDKKVGNFLKNLKVVEYIRENFENENFETAKEMIAYFFGNIARCKKGSDKNDSSK